MEKFELLFYNILARVNPDNKSDGFGYGIDIDELNKFLTIIVFILLFVCIFLLVYVFFLKDKINQYKELEQTNNNDN